MPGYARTLEPGTVFGLWIVTGVGIPYVQPSTGKKASTSICVCQGCGKEYSVLNIRLKRRETKQCMPCGNRTMIEKRNKSRKETKAINHPHDPHKINWIKLFDSLKSAAYRRDLLVEITLQEFIEIASKPCFFGFSTCISSYNFSVFAKKDGSPTANAIRSHKTDQEIENSKITVSGIDRFNNKLGYELGNCVPCCPKCNRVKGTSNISDLIFNAEVILSRKEEFLSKQSK